MSLSPARRIAFDILRRVEAQGAYASDLLHMELTPETKRTDAALATELTLGVLRWRRLLDFLLAKHLTKQPANLDLEVALALQIGIYQARFLRRIPLRAVVNESVELVKKARKSSAASLVNAVLRSAAAEAANPVEPRVPADYRPAERLGIIHSHPTWMVERWLENYGPARTEALLEANNCPASLCLAVHPGHKSQEVLSGLHDRGLRVSPGKLVRSAIIVSRGSPARTQPFRNGWISVQDEASQMIPMLLGVVSNQSVLDLCAAPGGKTISLTHSAGAGGFVVATDRHAHRLQTLRAHLQRCGVRNVRLVQLDAEKALPFRATFDRILVDAPCSGTGTLSRHPEIRWRLGPGELAEFQRRQTALLRSALAVLAPGGRLVYSTCSLEPEENEDVIEKVLQNTPGVALLRHAEISEMFGGLEGHLATGVSPKDLFDPRGYFRTFPPDRGTDGFFAVVIQRTTS